MKNKPFLLVLSLCIIISILIESTNVYANCIPEITIDDERELLASQYFDQYFSNISASSGGIICAGAYLSTYNAKNSIISGKIQELRNGIWYTVDTMFLSSTSKSASMGATETYNGISGRKYRIHVTYTVYTGAGKETRTSISSIVAIK